MFEEKIVSVAALWRAEPPVIVSMPAPARHDDLRMAFMYSGQDLKMGFLTSSGCFVNRKEAAQIALEAGQINHETDSLISQELW